MRERDGRKSLNPKQQWLPTISYFVLMLFPPRLLLLLSLIPTLSGTLLSEQHDPIAIYLQATETFSEGLVYVLRQRGVLSGWRKEMLTQVELLNNLTLEQRLNKNSDQHVPLWNATALEGIVEKKLMDYGYQEEVINHGKTTHVDAPRNWTLESTLLSHEAVTRLLLASTQIEEHILRPNLRLHVKQARDQQAQQSAPNRHFVSPFQPLLYSRSNAYNAGDFVNTIDLTNKLATSLGLTMPESFLLRNRLFYTAIQPIPYASPRPHPPVKHVPNLQAGRANDGDEARSRETRLSQSFIVYNSRGAYTGGSTALRLLAEELTRLGHDVLFCDDKNAIADVHSSFEPMCLDPPLTSVVVTGEWCRAVLTEYGVKPHRGRTVQYHLGFHHDNPCNAAVPLAASHYLAAQLGSRMLGGYYLSAPMNNLVRDAFVELLLKGKMLDSGSSGTFFESGADGLGRYLELEKLVLGKSTEDILSSTVSWGHGDQKLLSVPKENIVVIDTDFSENYPPEMPVPYSLPPGFRVVYARDIHPKDVPLLLQRAKVLLDLAMPGPERMVSEAILFGAVTVISKFWNGVSEVDFPGLMRVDPHNSTSLTETLKFALLNYESLVADPVTHGRFFSYVVSQWERHHSTSRLLASSASLHFVLVARGLDEERIAILRAFALLFMYPWASIDIYVRDVRWFLRHHYLAATLLKRGGYLRKDVGNPQDFDVTTTFLPSRGSGSYPDSKDSSDPRGGASLVRIQHLSFLRDCTVGKGLLDHAGVQGRESIDPPEWRLVPPWAKSVIVLTSSPDPLPSTQQTAMVFAEPLFLVELIEGYESGGLISLLPANGGGESSPAAVIMSAHRAIEIHGCPSDPWPIGPREGRGGSSGPSPLPSVLHELATGRHNDLDDARARSLPDPRVRVELESNAMIDLLKTPEDGLGDVKFIDGLRKTPSWLELNSFYSQV